MTPRSRSIYSLIGYVLIAGGVLMALYPFIPSINYSITHFRSDSQNPAPFTEDAFLPTEQDVTPLTDNQNSNPAPADTNTASTGSSGHPTNRLTIKKIGVSIPIVDGNTASALERGAWRLPASSSPPHIGNTILTAHRYKYLPPSSKTFYLLDKLKVGDTFSIEWEGKTYRYGIDKREIKDASDLSMFTDTYDRRVTLITCHPLFSIKERLIVSGRLLKNT